jgi:5-methylcytosine-specific restriction endonuclease McrA
MEPLTYISWQRAVCLILEGRAYALESDEEYPIRSKDLELPMPTIVALTQYVVVPFLDRKLGKQLSCSKRGVLRRDNFTCGYCGRDGADTVDHIVPQCRGGLSTWENLIACCKDCNQLKADLSLKEAGMKTLWETYVPDVTKELEQKVWDLLSA